MLVKMCPELSVGGRGHPLPFPGRYYKHGEPVYTVNVEFFAQYIFSRILRMALDA